MRSKERGGRQQRRERGQWSEISLRTSTIPRGRLAALCRRSATPGLECVLRKLLRAREDGAVRSCMRAWTFAALSGRMLRREQICSECIDRTRQTHRRVLDRILGAAPPRVALASCVHAWRAVAGRAWRERLLQVERDVAQQELHLEYHAFQRATWLSWERSQARCLKRLSFSGWAQVQAAAPPEVADWQVSGDWQLQRLKWERAESTTGAHAQEQAPECWGQLREHLWLLWAWGQARLCRRQTFAAWLWVARSPWRSERGLQRARSALRSRLLQDDLLVCFGAWVLNAHRAMHSKGLARQWTAGGSVVDSPSEEEEQ